MRISPFQDSQVVIVDDKPSEALPIIEAFSKLNIAVAWYRGTGEEDFPEKPLSGVRLLVLDLVLNTPNFDANYATGAVFNTIAPTLISGPFILVLWTAHPDDKEVFLAALQKYNEPLGDAEKVLPLAVVAISKNELGVDRYITDKQGLDSEPNGSFNAQGLIDRVKGVLDELSPFGILINWETSCSNAAKKTVSGVSSMALTISGMDTEAWKGKVQELMDWLAEAAGGVAVTRKRDNPPYIGALYESLAMIQDDAIRLLNSPEEGNYIPKPDGVSAKAALNTIILTSLAEVGDMPGVVLCLESLENSGDLFSPNIDEKPYRQFVSNFFGHNYNKKNKDEILESCASVLIEVSPGCDYAQNKRKRLRFVVGLLIPIGLDGLLLGNAGFIKKIGPIVYGEKELYLAIDSLNFHSVPLDQSQKLAKPMFRIRNHVLVDIQAWLGGHLSRPGHLSIKNYR